MAEQHETPVEGSESEAAAPEQPAKNKRKKRDKVRSAWISFVGRIVAQIMGAVATISLGLMVVHQYQSASRTDSSPPTPPADRSHPLPVRLATPGEVSIAVLPLETYSGDAREFFAEAVTEAVITDLSRIKGLHVISRTSSTQYKEPRKPLPEIARELGADLIVEGSVTHSANRVRIAAQLIDAKRDTHLWAESYDRTLRDVLSVQAEVAWAIARGVKIAVAPNEKEEGLSTPSTAARVLLPIRPAATPQRTPPAGH